MRGKLIVLEGTDGSGKATQARLLLQSLEEGGTACREIDFPRYGNPFAEPANLYLHGALGGKPGDVNAYAASVMFAVDRFASYKEDWGGFYESGGVVVANRYTTSNAVHQASKLPEGERQAFLDWLFDLEYRRLGLPEPDLLIRTCNEQRVSNFLLWQLAYTELYFTPVSWPDFSKEELEKAVEAYNKRDRKFGLVKNQ